MCVRCPSLNLMGWVLEHISGSGMIVRTRTFKVPVELLDLPEKCDDLYLRLTIDEICDKSSLYAAPLCDSTHLISWKKIEREEIADGSYSFSSPDLSETYEVCTEIDTPEDIPAQCLELMKLIATPKIPRRIKPENVESWLATQSTVFVDVDTVVF